MTLRQRAVAEHSELVDAVVDSRPDNASAVDLHHVDLVEPPMRRPLSRGMTKIRTGGSPADTGSAHRRVRLVASVSHVSDRRHHHGFGKPSRVGGTAGQAPRFVEPRTNSEIAT